MLCDKTGCKSQVTEMYSGKVCSDSSRFLLLANRLSLDHACVALVAPAG